MKTIFITGATGLVGSHAAEEALKRGHRVRALVRPTSDRLRETLFNILGAEIEDSLFIDVCAGTGAMGIEALSRGAREALFNPRKSEIYRTVEQPDSAAC